MLVEKGFPKWLLFAIFLSLVVVDRWLTLTNFGFIYADIDQLVLWNGAMDYSKGIFHEPFFYGQAYNYMLESFVAVPLLWLHMPVYMALPITTSLISLLPFVVLALFFFKKQHHFWAYLTLAFPLLLPIEYNFLTTLSRGFVQAHLFAPLLFIPFFNPQHQKNVTLLFLAAGLCFIANQSVLLILLPILLYVYSYHFRTFSFYLKSLLVLPFFVADYLAKYFYVVHPEKVLHRLVGLMPDSDILLASLTNTRHFENLFPFFSGWGIVYPLLFVGLMVVALYRHKPKAFLFVFSGFILLVVTLAIPKIQEIYANAGLFFTPGRFYLYLPILLILSLFLVFHKIKYNALATYLLLLLAGINLVVKNVDIKQKVASTIMQTVFPVAKTRELLSHARELRAISADYQLDLIVHASAEGWKYVFDSYAFHPLSLHERSKHEHIISVNLSGDRRSWLYPSAKHSKQILLNGFEIDQELLQPFDHEVLNNKQLVIRNNALEVADLLARLNLKFGN